MIVKLGNSEDKGKILKAARDKKSLTFLGRIRPLQSDLAAQKVLAGYIQGPP